MFLQTEARKLEPGEICPQNPTSFFRISIEEEDTAALPKVIYDAAPRLRDRAKDTAQGHSWPPKGPGPVPLIALAHALHW